MLYFRVQASDHNNAGEYENAKQCGQMALCCNICTIVKYVIAIVLAIILVIVYFTVGYAWLTGSAAAADNCINKCSYDYYTGLESCHYSCTSY